MKFFIQVILSLTITSLGSILFNTTCAHSQKTSFTTIKVTTPLSPIQQIELLAKLQNQGVQVIQQGSRLQLILPINQFFVGQSIDIKEEQVKTLRLVALYLHNYIYTNVTCYPIKVYAYTGKVTSRKYQVYITNQYAQVIASFLWSQGFLPTQMRVVGFGAKSPIGNYITPEGNAFNRRVMIQVN